MTEPGSATINREASRSRLFVFKPLQFLLLGFFAVVASVQAAGAFITGVAFNDLDAHNSYGLGEGVAGIEVRPAWGRYYAVTSNSGGFAISLAALGRQPGVVRVSLPFPVAPDGPWEKAGPYDAKFRADQIRKAPSMDVELRWTSKHTGLSLKSKVTIKRPMLVEYRLMGTDGMFFPRSMITSSSVKADLVYTKGRPRVVMP